MGQIAALKVLADGFARPGRPLPSVLAAPGGPYNARKGWAWRLGIRPGGCDFLYNHLTLLCWARSGVEGVGSLPDRTKQVQGNPGAGAPGRCPNR